MTRRGTSLQSRAELFTRRAALNDQWVPRKKLSSAWRAGYAAAVRDQQRRGKK